MNRRGTDSIPPSPMYPDLGVPTDFLAQFASSLEVGPEEALGMLGDRLLSYEPLARRRQSKPGGLASLASRPALDPAERAQSEA